MTSRGVGDNDPIVLAHARALLTSTAAGKTAYIDADLRDAEAMRIIDGLMATLPPGSALALSTVTADSTPVVDDAHVHMYGGVAIKR